MIWSAALQTDPRQQQQHAYCVHRARGMCLNVSGQNRLSIIACLSLLMRLVRNLSTMKFLFATPNLIGQNLSNVSII